MVVGIRQSGIRWCTPSTRVDTFVTLNVGVEVVFSVRMYDNVIFFSFGKYLLLMVKRINSEKKKFLLITCDRRIAQNLKRESEF